ncbi:RxLR effector protein [Phytophthora megakarya]|uniref:RxLR effector protein n=1 Tax=Phytophthora megakarya TaxID=4795 RepID=A0A225UXW7_9STRA|nr:RxLR effector protein [Phytophthora megakarya]
MLATLFTLLFCSANANPNKISTPVSVPGRLRRLSNTVDTAFPEVKESEERGILSNIKTNLGDWMKTSSWATFGMSDAYVKSKLGLQNLQGTALTNHPNYRLLAKFHYKVEGRMLDKWLLSEGLTLSGAWKRLKLDRIPQNDVMRTDAYKTYVHYVKKYDRLTYGYKNGFFEAPREYGGSHAQIMAKVKVWAAARRPSKYVQEMLGLKESTMMASKYYKEFLRLRAK